jgi:hypothetical protein
VGGRNQVRKVGLQPVQRDGLEYEFTVVGDVTQEHDLIVTKTRAAFLKDAVIREAGEDLGKQLAAWLAGGTDQRAGASSPPALSPARPVAQAAAPVPLADEIAGHIREAKTVRSLGRMGDRLDELLSDGQLDADQVVRLQALISERHDELEPQPAN